MLRCLVLFSFVLIIVHAIYHPCKVKEGYFYLKTDTRWFSYYASYSGTNDPRLGLSRYSSGKYVFKLQYANIPELSFFYHTRFTLRNVVGRGVWKQFANLPVTLGERMSLYQPKKYLSLATSDKNSGIDLIAYCEKDKPNLFRLRVPPTQSTRNVLAEPIDYIGASIQGFGFDAYLYSGAPLNNAALFELVPVPGFEHMTETEEDTI